MKYDNLAISMWNGATTQHEYVFIMRRGSAARHRLALPLCNLLKQNATVHKKCTKSQRTGA
jgi:ligand-binding sensor protein